MGGPLSPSASEEIPPRVVRSDRPACDALALFAKMPQRPPGLRCPHKRKSIHINLSDTFVKTLTVLYRSYGISMLIHIHINMFDAFVKKLTILYCSCGMSLILHIHTNWFQTFAIPTR